jgi:hypothetical protein
VRASRAGLPAVVWLGALLPGAASGQESGAITVDATECVKLTSPAERLACFEAGVDDALRERAPAAAPSAPAAPAQRAPAAPAASSRPAAAPTEPAARSSGAHTPPAAPQPARAEPARQRAAEPARSARRDRDRDADAEDSTPTEIVGVIAELRETVPNSYVITLADGQVWRQTRAAPYPLTTGATVRIYEVERWGGSYRLTAVGRKGFIQVAPVR